MSNPILKDAVITAQNLVQTFFSKNTHLQHTSILPIPITTEKNASGWGGNSTAQTFGLKVLAEGLCSKIILIKEFDEELAPGIQGFLVEKDSCATIYVSRSLNFCWRRFIVAKELSHLLMNKINPSLRLQNVQDCNEIKALLSVLLTHSEKANTSAEISEYMAYLGALELLMPKQYMDQIIQSTDQKIADKLRIPIQASDLRKSKNDSFEDVYQSFDIDLVRVQKLFS